MGFGTRLLASLLDAMLFLALLLPLTILIPPYLSVSLLCLLPLLTLYCWTCLGGTPGKLLMGCEMVDARSGQHLSLRQALLRYMAYGLSLLPLGLGFFWIAFDPRKQGLHDRLAGTLVVREDESDLSLAQLQQQLR